jgi:hypothetical protein
MIPIIPKVNPGDLITADRMNQMASAIANLDARLTVLEATGPVANPVRIDGFTVNQPVRVGDQIEVNGAGFLIPAVLNAVTMGNVPVTSFAMMSGASKLVFTVPAIPNVPVNGTAVTVALTNANGSATSPQLIVFPKVDLPSGQTQVLYTNAPVMPFNQPNITAGQVYIFTFEITAFTDRNVSYAIAPGITGANWLAKLVETSPQPVTQNGTLPIHVQVTAAAGTGVLTLNVTETTSGTKVTPGTIQLTIVTGSPPPTPDNRVRVAFRTAGLGATLAGGAIEFKRNQQGAVGFTVTFTEQGDYVINPTMRAPTGWTRNGVDIQNVHVNQPPQGQTGSQDVNVLFTAGAQAASTDLMFTVTRPPNLSVTYVQPVTVVP